MKKKTIGIYGGSFNPIHLGHLNLAYEMLEIHRLHEILFCPTGCHPHQKELSVSASHRLNMIQLAIEEEPRFRISDIEIYKQDPCYTIDTLNAFIAAEQDKKKPPSFALILGEDTAHDFWTWRQPEEIIETAQLLVGRRTHSQDASAFRGNPAIVAAIEKGLTDTRIMEISSQEIRHRLFDRQPCAHLLPRKVMDYIYTNHLYFDPSTEVRFL
jgi:nicotinate-nucleotide adenylyltransferase